MTVTYTEIAQWKQNITADELEMPFIVFLAHKRSGVVLQWLSPRHLYYRVAEGWHHRNHITLEWKIHRKENGQLR